MRHTQPWEPECEIDRPGICSTGVEVALLIGAAVAAAGAAYGVYASGQAAEAAGELNADIAEQQAVAARGSAAVDEEVSRERARRIQAASRAAYGASGVTQESGSPLLVVLDNAKQAELEAQRIRYSGELAAAGFANVAQQQRFQGAQAAAAGTTGAGVSLLSSGGRIATRAYYGPPARPGEAGGYF